ncbi:WbqC family protein [Rufibacter hautae]|uniref:WbqC family protein n=1 Tax=Rufibacter hautae TaxID=2595005 RepID=A0A5B6TG69_9BACT|nr:WbqC family protein [Rufibacter hautae]KAA3439263.1 WbqC family protein [Rufibacter hautae]
MQLLTDLHYNPSILYFQKAFEADELLFEAHEHYQKQSYRNRCHILTAQGVVPLSVPVVKGNSKTLVTELEIDYGQRWMDIHWRTIQSAYGSAPFFEFYADYLKAVYDQKPDLLFQLNMDLLKLFVKFLKLKKPVGLTQTYVKTYEAPVLDWRGELHPKKVPDNLRLMPYRQVFGKQFAINLSILDLLFNLGPEASTYLQSPLDYC